MPLAARSEQSRPIRPNISRTRKRRWQEGATHRYWRLVSAESQLGTLPVSALWLRNLHARSGLGRSAVLRRTHSNDVPLRYPRTVPIGRGTPCVLRGHIAGQGSPLRVPQQPCCRPAPLDAPDMPRARSRADRSDPPRPHAQTPLARRGHAQCTKIDERGERARHTPSQLIVEEVSAHPERTRPLGRCYAAPTATMCPYGTRALNPTGWECPLSTP
jgi:hypothetical protein